MQIQKSWDPIWEQIFREEEWGKYPPKHVIRFINRRWNHVADRSNIRLLDLGCGPGACTWYFAREGFFVAGIDGSPTAIERARCRLEAERLNADLRVGDFVKLPWPDDYFDGVIDNATLCCNRFSSCLEVRDEVLRVLKPGGRFQSCNFTDTSWGYGLGREVGENEFEDITGGPLKGRGFALFMSRHQIDKLFTGFETPSIEQISWTAENMGKVTSLWVVEAAKPSR